MSPVPINLILADDHPVVRRGLRAFLDAEPSVVVGAECASGTELLNLRIDVPHVVLLDLLMPGGGADLVRQLRQQRPLLRLLVLTSSEDPEQLGAVLDAGAHALLLKDASPEQLLDAIQAVAAGQAYWHPRVQDLIRPRRPRVSLSQREREVLGLISQGASNADIATQLGIGIKTVKTHVSNLLLKLGVDDRTQAAVRALREKL